MSDNLTVIWDELTPQMRADLLNYVKAYSSLGPQMHTGLLPFLSRARVFYILGIAERDLSRHYSYSYDPAAVHRLRQIRKLLHC